MIHKHENNQDTETFLKANGDKFTGDTLTAIRLMFSGIRLTSQDCWEKYHIHDRRLRDAIKARPDIVKKEWKLNSEGKRMFVEYFIETFKPPIKSELQTWFTNYQNDLYETQFR